MVYMYRLCQALRAYLLWLEGFMRLPMMMGTSASTASPKCHGNHWQLNSLHLSVIIGVSAQLQRPRCHLLQRLRLQCLRLQSPLLQLQLRHQLLQRL